MKEVVSKEVALSELHKFVNSYAKVQISESKAEEMYPDVLDAIQFGFLTIDESQIPKYKLKDPIKGEDGGSVVLDSLSFRTRIKPTEMRKIAFGIDFKNDPIGFQHKAIAFITEQPELMIDKYSRYDCDVIQQICTVFM